MATFIVTVPDGGIDDLAEPSDNAAWLAKLIRSQIGGSPTDREVKVRELIDGAVDLIPELTATVVDDFSMESADEGFGDIMSVIGKLPRTQFNKFDFGALNEVGVALARAKALIMCAFGPLADELPDDDGCPNNDDAPKEG